MPSSNKNSANNISGQEKDRLFFKYLPGYAAFILENMLEDYVKEQLRFSREEKVPLLKFFEHLSDEELIEMGKTSGREFLTVFIENRVKEHIQKSLEGYIKNRIPDIEREQIVAEDITIISFIRKKTFRNFLAFYTKDFSLYNNVMEEVDRFVKESETLTFNAYLEIQQEKISRINAELEKKQEELLEAQGLADMGSFLWDFKDGKSVYTPGVMKIFDMAKSSNLSEFMKDVHEDDRHKLQEAIDKAITDDGKYDCEYRFVKNGVEKRIWSRGIVNFHEGKATSMKGTVMNVTDKYKMLTQLQESEELNKLAQAITHIGNWRWEIATNTITWSDEMYRIYGLVPQSENITFERFVSLIHADDRENRIKEIQESLQTLHVNDYIMRIVNPDGAIKVLRGKGEVVTDKNNKAVKLLGTCQDITNEKYIADELQAKSHLLEKLNTSLEFKNAELERINKELESFNYVASHDLQEPLRKIQVFANRIIEKSILPPTAMEYFGKIIVSSTRMQMLIEDLLTFSQTTPSENNFEFTDLNSIVEEVKNLLSHAIEGKKVVIESVSLPAIKIVPFQFQQLLLNLIGNAIKYSQENTVPYIRMTSRYMKGDRMNITGAVRDKTYLELKVEDNGIGFDEENAEKIFGLFQRLHNKDKYSGTGIGLAICKKIVHHHHGFIMAKSTPGKGSAFYVYLPHENSETHTTNLMN